MTTAQIPFVRVFARGTHIVIDGPCFEFVAEADLDAACGYRDLRKPSLLRLQDEREL